MVNRYNLLTQFVSDTECLVNHLIKVISFIYRPRLSLYGVFYVNCLVCFMQSEHMLSALLSRAYYIGPTRRMH